jgi:hypothetical protein
MNEAKSVTQMTFQEHYADRAAHTLDARQLVAKCTLNEFRQSASSWRAQVICASVSAPAA